MERVLAAKLLTWKNRPSRKPILIDGARQTGKTHLLKHLLGAEFANVLLVDFLERPTLRAAFDGSLAPGDVVKNLELLTGKSFNPASDLLVFDEIGECRPAVTSLKYFAEQTPTWWVAASGSNIGLLDSFPVGKVEHHELRPLSLREFLRASGESALVDAFEARNRSAAAHVRLSAQLLDYYFVGGMPEAVESWFALRDASLPERERAVRTVQSNLIAGYRNDFGKYAGKWNAQTIRAVFDNIPRQLQSVNDESARRFQFKDVAPGKNRYAHFANAIHWLESCKMVLKNYPLTGQPRWPLAAYRKDNCAKLFCHDVGLLTGTLNLSLLQLRQNGFEYKGFLAENFVQQELAALGITPTYSWHANQAEVEFLLGNDHGEVFPVEVKSGVRTRARSLRSYMERYQPRQAFKLVGKAGGGSHGALTVLPLYYAEALPEWQG